MSLLVFIWLMRQFVVAFIDTQPVHFRVANGIRNLEGGHARKIVHKTIDHQIHLHL